MKFSKTLGGIATSLAIFLTSSSSFAINEDLKLPNLGESSTSLFSAEHEFQIGRMWLRFFRSRNRGLDDPIIHEYIEDLVFKLVTHSQLEDRRLEIVVVDNPSINAFAVPGGIVGIHLGLLVHARTEDEIASVMAHEIAHLSQRHFSRSIEYAKRQQPLTLATMLAGLVLLTTGAGDAGLAALTAGQAASQDASLSYSRSNEAEADRLGMKTLFAAGFNPNGVASMFENMLNASKFSGTNQIPEFMRTHPLSENRIADARNRARDYPQVKHAPNLTYQLMRARAKYLLADSADQAITSFANEYKKKKGVDKEAAAYGLSLVLTRAGRSLEARKALTSLSVSRPNRIEYLIADAEIDILEEKTSVAVSKLEARLAVTPENHPLTMAYANALIQNEQAHVAEEILIKQAKVRPNDPGLWYLLAEVQGLAGNIVGLHQSRAEFFILHGNLDEAEKQLNYALALSQTDYQISEIVYQRLKDIQNIREKLDD